MFIFIAELMIFLSILWWVTYSFSNSKKITNVDNIKIQELITELNGSWYEKMYYNTKADKKKSIIYKEIVLEFQTGSLNNDLCTLINKK